MVGRFDANISFRQHRTKLLASLCVVSFNAVENYRTVFRHAIRTNNDIEGWHQGLNRRASGRGLLPMYLLIKLLHREAMLTAIQIRLVSEKKLRRIQRRIYRDLQAKIFRLWDEFDASERSAKRLLKACSHLNGPIEK